ncbi:hypothetical protein Purlil1_12623 [Purpureocillium lilacinum]|uniref:Uncharacterized protein n=1 Tax=Purpureocillium lilacinum TaxID=33203 RepID=A0ABR0BGE0_PURLI|nr:hypothetical protein Purlil1_12623 [Purpureocillium lilacinum]
MPRGTTTDGDTLYLGRAECQKGALDRNDKYECNSPTRNIHERLEGHIHERYDETNNSHQLVPWPWYVEYKRVTAELVCLVVPARRRRTGRPSFIQILLSDLFFFSMKPFTLATAVTAFAVLAAALPQTLHGPRDREAVVRPDGTRVTRSKEQGVGPDGNEWGQLRSKEQDVNPDGTRVTRSNVHGVDSNDNNW